MEDKFGCEQCWPAEAGAAWKARGALGEASVLVDESHFIVRVLVCGRCGQRFLTVFTETIDWDGGDDSQDWTLLPVTEAEITGLAKEPDVEGKLEGIAPQRRSLRLAHPTGAERQVSWSKGIFVGMHD